MFQIYSFAPHAWGKQQPSSIDSSCCLSENTWTYLTNHFTLPQAVNRTNITILSFHRFSLNSFVYTFQIRVVQSMGLSCFSIFRLIRPKPHVPFPKADLTCFWSTSTPLLLNSSASKPKSPFNILTIIFCNWFPQNSCDIRSLAIVLHSIICLMLLYEVLT